MNQQKDHGFHSNWQRVSESRSIWDIWVQPAWIQLTPARTHHGNRAEHQSALRNPGTFKGQKHWTGLDVRQVASAGRTETGTERALGRVWGQRWRGVRWRGLHSSRLRSASRESTSARGARQKVKDENSDRKSCRENQSEVRRKLMLLGEGLIPQQKPPQLSCRRDDLSALMSQRYCVTWLTSEEESSLPAALRAGWASTSPRSSSSDRSSSGIGCLQNRKESYWLFDLSIISESEETPGMMVKTRSQDYHQLICLKLDQHYQWNRIKP